MKILIDILYISDIFVMEKGPQLVIALLICMIFYSKNVMKRPHPKTDLPVGSENKMQKRTKQKKINLE
jgi:hypothetical protein